MSEYAIYGLVDPRDEKIRYVGISTNVFRRYMDHVRYKDLPTPKITWIKELHSIGLNPLLMIIDTAVNEFSARYKEEQWIKHYGKDLTNYIHNTANVDGGTRVDDPDLSALVDAQLREEASYDI